VDFRLSLIPLEHAVKAAYRHFYGEAPKQADQATDDKLNAIASLMAQLVPIYEYDPDPDVTARPLLRADLAGAVFKRGGKDVTYADGRAADVPLAVSANDVAKVVQEMKKLIA
jgi:hypothetical protein